mgnify:FL=1
MYFYKIFPFIFSHKKVLIHNENELIIETAAALALRGFQLKKLTPLKK